jgi:hypothetical protein
MSNTLTKLVFCSPVHQPSDDSELFGHWVTGESSPENSFAGPASVASVEISIGDAVVHPQPPALVETDEGESSEQHEEEDVEMGILDRISECQQDIVFVPSDDDENDSQDFPPAEALRSTTEDDSEDGNSDEYNSDEAVDLENQQEESCESAEDSSGGDNSDDNSEKDVDLENPKEEDDEEITPRHRFKSAALAVTVAVALGAIKVIEQSNDVDETDLEMGIREGGEAGAAKASAAANDGGGTAAQSGANEAAQNAGNQGAAKASSDGAGTGKSSGDGVGGGAKGGGNDGGGAGANGGGNDGGGAGAKAAGNDGGGGAGAKATGNDGGAAAAKGGGGQQSNPPQ